MEKLDLEFYTGINFKTHTCVVCDKNGVLECQKIFPGASTIPLRPSLIDFEKDVYTKAIWIAKTIKDYLNIKELNLTLKSNLLNLELVYYANKIGINLKPCWIEEGQINPINKYPQLNDKNFDVKKYCQENKLNNSVNHQENANDNKDVPVVDND